MSLLLRAGILFLIIYLQACNHATAAEAQPDSSVQDTSLVKAASDSTSAEEKKKKEKKAFDEIVEDFEKIEGLFTFYRKDDEGKVYLEIRPHQFEKTYLCGVTREAGDGFYFDSAAMTPSFMTYGFPFILKRIGPQVQFLHKNVYIRADEGTPLSRAVEKGITNALLSSAKIIESKPHPTRNSILVDASALFVQDITMVSAALGARKLKYGFDSKTSHFGQVKSFPANSEIDVVLYYKSGDPKNAYTLPDPRSFQHVYRYSLTNLPNTGYRSRPADDRVGHFSTVFMDYSSKSTDTRYTRVINRWRLEKEKPNARLSKPVKPITFWIENTVPDEYRKTIKKGILVWNDAFERIGFKNAIVVKDQPDDPSWDPEDARYSTVRWFINPMAIYAQGPSIANPLTGEIFSASVRVNAEFPLAMFRRYERFAEPVATAPGAQMPAYSDNIASCDYAEGAIDQAAFGLNLLSARGILELGSKEARDFVNAYLAHVIAHEVGHTLGLRHNFKASTLHPAGKLQDKAYTEERGMVGSVMDYTPINIAPEGQEQGHYMPTGLGPYDYWAIEYAYKPLKSTDPEKQKKELEGIVSKAADPRVAYLTDEDSRGAPTGIDPSSNRWDLGNDPIQFFKNRVALSRELWSKTEVSFEKNGERYPKLRSVFERGLREYSLAAQTLTKYIGGIYLRRDHVGDPEGRLPFEPVPPAKQREAFEFLKENVFGQNAFAFSPSLLRKLAPERLWGFSGAVYSMRRLDYPVHEQIFAIQRNPLNTFYHPLLLQRLLDLELWESEHPFALPELFEGLRVSIWSELEAGSNINSFRRNLQRAHLDKVITLVVNPAKGAPTDASALARADLIEIRNAIANRDAAVALDRSTGAHLDEVAARIEAALVAGIERQM
jgi:hypothetical protein